MRNLTLVFAGIALVACITAANLWRELRAARLLVAQPQSQSNQGAPAPAPAGAAPFQSIANAPLPVAASAGSGSADPPVPAPDAPARALRIDQGELLKDPGYRDAMLAQIRLQMPLNYPGLIQELALSPQEADALFDLLAANQLALQGLMVPIEPGRPMDRTAMDQMMNSRRELDRQHEDSIAALLGSARYSQWKEYQQSLPARSQVTQLARTMEAAGQPLSDAQNRALVAAYAAELTRRGQEAPPMRRDAGAAGAQDAQRMMETNLRVQSESNRRLIDAAAPHLSSQQLETLRTSLEQQLAMSSALARVQREQMQQQGLAAAPAADLVLFSAGAAMPLPLPPPPEGAVVIATRP